MTDAHALAAETPVIDECTQDWTLLSTEAGNGSLVFEAERALDTGDTQDRVFTDDSNEGACATTVLAILGLPLPFASEGPRWCYGATV